MLPRQARVPRRLFSDSFSKSTTIHSDFFTFRVHRPAKAERRMAVVVSSKVAKHAVDRNLLRRRAYEALDRLIPKSASLVLLVFAKKGAPQLSFKALESQIALNLKKISLT